ncbi:aquaporin TIP1-1 [Hibiscus syriacus]|uniref:Very-long-chain (3R)-3-hydroxyacyl-CoA dehydratase n=1 Tax=Hibiscus syriacus TaxID=106335 RepID=A0A6A2XL12_HIBSY|nr:aquaporin TIP1-1 [Hibiscus syriacus]
MAQLLKLSLFTYNSIQAFGWTISLFRILTSFIAINSVNGAYDCAGDLICQFVANLCILGSCTWSNRDCSKWSVVPLMQWGGRTHFLLAIVLRIHEVQEVPAVFITFFAWSLTEVIRYSYYALNIFGGCPSWLTYLRYTTFIVLYPLGLAPGERPALSFLLFFFSLKNEKRRTLSLLSKFPSPDRRETISGRPPSNPPPATTSGGRKLQNPPQIKAWFPLKLNPEFSFISLDEALVGPVIRVKFGESPNYVVTHPIVMTWGLCGTPGSFWRGSSQRRRCGGSGSSGGWDGIIQPLINLGFLLGSRFGFGCKWASGIGPVCK